MIIRSQHVSIESSLPPQEVVELIQERAAEWRESRRTAVERSASVLRWRLKVKRDTLVLYPLLLMQRDTWFTLVPRFKGKVIGAGAGSRIIGTVSIPVFHRVMVALFLGLMAVAGWGATIGQRSITPMDAAVVSTTVALVVAGVVWAIIALVTHRPKLALLAMLREVALVQEGRTERF